MLSLRRGSLPVNAFPIPESSVDSPIGDCFDPLSRRRSVDASLQRLASNPFANLARAKNSALYGPNFGVAPVPSGRHHQLAQQGRPSYPYPAPHQRRNASNLGPNMMPFPPQGQLPQGAGPIRRSSMDSSRSTAISSYTSSRLHSASSRIHQSQSPSPSPLTPFNAAIRASLPDGNLYALSTRPVASPIPGPLPSPGFSFGAASSNNSMASPSSGGDSDRNSPDSLRSFNFRQSANGNGSGNVAYEDEDDATNSSVHQSPLFDPYDANGYSQPSSRFGSIASIATSESSVASSAGLYYQDGLLNQDGPLNSDRRDSCASTGFLGMMSGLDVGSGHSVDTIHQMGLAAGGYTSHEDYSNYVQVETVNTCRETGEVQGCQPQPQQQHQSQMQQPAEMSYPSPASTISAQGSPHVQDISVASVANNGDVVTISTSSELAFALEGKPEQVRFHSFFSKNRHSFLSVS